MVKEDESIFMLFCVLWNDFVSFRSILFNRINPLLHVLDSFFIQGMYFFGGLKMSDAEYMEKLAIELAKKGAGYVQPRSYGWSSNCKR